MESRDNIGKRVFNHVNHCECHVYYFHGESCNGFKFWSLTSIGAIEKWMPQHNEIFGAHLRLDQDGVTSYVRIASAKGGEYGFDIFIAGKTMDESLAYASKRLKALTNRPLECADMVETMDDLIELEDPIWVSYHLSCIL